MRETDSSCLSSGLVRCVAQAGALGTEHLVQNLDKNNKTIYCLIKL